MPSPAFYNTHQARLGDIRGLCLFLQYMNAPEWELSSSLLLWVWQWVSPDVEVASSHPGPSLGTCVFHFSLFCPQYFIKLSSVFFDRSPKRSTIMYASFSASHPSSSWAQFAISASELIVSMSCRREQNVNVLGCCEDAISCYVEQSHGGHLFCGLEPRDTLSSEQLVIQPDVIGAELETSQCILVMRGGGRFLMSQFFLGTSARFHRYLLKPDGKARSNHQLSHPQSA